MSDNDTPCDAYNIARSAQYVLHYAFVHASTARTLTHTHKRRRLFYLNFKWIFVHCALCRAAFSPMRVFFQFVFPGFFNVSCRVLCENACASVH